MYTTSFFLKYYFFFLFLFLFFSSCQPEPEFKEVNVVVDSHFKPDSSIQIFDSQIVKVTIDTGLTKISLAIAGMYDSIYFLKNDSFIFNSWDEHVEMSAKIWRKTEEKIPYMEKWSEMYIDSGSTLFYPFSGPDFLHADVFFPTVDTMILIGLEPLGSIPKGIDDLKNLNLNFFRNLRSSLSSILQFSFFLTKEMEVDFFSKLDGTLSAILHFASRRSYDVISIRHIYLDEFGVVNYDTLSKNSGTEFIFLKDGKQKTVYYFSANLKNVDYLSDGKILIGFDQNFPFKRFLENFNFSFTYLKAASYLLHNNSYSSIRKFILTNSKSVLQDDSGIPFSFYKSQNWEYNFFGVYSDPIPLFSSRAQKDLKEIYDEMEPLNLPFGIGYKWRIGSSNLQFFRKKDYVVEDSAVHFVPNESQEISSISSVKNLSNLYVIGCYAVENEDYANQLKSKLLNLNFSSDYIFIPNYYPNGKKLFRVYVGPFSTLNEAKTFLPSVKKYIPDAYIDKLP